MIKKRRLTKMISIEQLQIKIFADGADKNEMLEMAEKPFIKGFTTNPTLMRKAGVTDYKKFSKEILQFIDTLPISFEVFSDDIDEMYEQAMLINSWADNVYVKIPVTNTKAEPCYDLINRLSNEGVNINFTAVFTLDQVEKATEALKDGPNCIISVFAGRIADAGIDPVPHMKKALEIINPINNIELLWASPREILNVVQANNIGCHIITATSDILKKLDLLGKDLNEFSLDTVKLFRNDAIAARYTI
jgi:transaldolase